MTRKLPPVLIVYSHKSPKVVKRGTAERKGISQSLLILLWPLIPPQATFRPQQWAGNEGGWLQAKQLAKWQNTRFCYSLSDKATSGRLKTSNFGHFLVQMP